MTQSEFSVEALEAFYADYIATFNRRDFAHVVQFFSFPWAHLDRDGIVHIIPDAAAQVSMWEHIRSDLDARKWSHSQVDHLQCALTGSDTGLIVAVFSRWATDGSLIERGRGHYAARCTPAGWRLITAWDAPVAGQP